MNSTLLFQRLITMPESVMPVQFFARPVDHAQGERALCLAILATAWGDLTANQNTRHHWYLANDARAWFLSDEDADDRFSFIYLAELFALDVAWIRATIRTTYHEQLKPPSALARKKMSRPFRSHDPISASLLCRSHGAQTKVRMYA